MDGTFYPLEMHFVHYRTSDGTIGDAVNAGETNSLAVLGVFFQAGEKTRAKDSRSEINLYGVTTW